MATKNEMLMIGRICNGAAKGEDWVTHFGEHPAYQNIKIPKGARNTVKDLIDIIQQLDIHQFEELMEDVQILDEELFNEEV